MATATELLTTTNANSTGAAFLLGEGLQEIAIYQTAGTWGGGTNAVQLQAASGGPWVELESATANKLSIHKVAGYAIRSVVTGATTPVGLSTKIVGELRVKSTTVSA